MHHIHTDTTWIPLLINGDRKTIQFFVDTYGNFMYNVCFRILLSKSEAEEATQDAVMKAINAISKYDPKHSFKGWCYTIAYRTAIDYKRAIKINLSLDQNSDITHDGSADQQIVQSETSIAISSLLSLLDDESRMIISLYYLEEKSIKEVIEITGLTESNIKIKLFRARKELAAHAPKFFEKI